MHSKSIAFLAAILAIAAAAQADTPLEVMSFNVCYGEVMDESNAWPRRKDVLVATIAQYAPDVVGTQECLEFQANYMAEHLPKYRWLGIGRNANGTGEMMAVFWKKEVLVPIESGNFWLSESPDVPGSISWNASCRRLVTWVRFHHVNSGKFFYFVNTHFDFKSREARERSAALLLERMDRFDRGLAMIVTGDFNARGGTSLSWNTLINGGFTDAWQAAETRAGPPVTLSRFAAPRPNVQLRFDWVLLRGPVRALYCETVTYNLDGRYPSDHYPVFARLTLKD